MYSVHLPFYCDIGFKKEEHVYYHMNRWIQDDYAKEHCLCIPCIISLVKQRKILDIWYTLHCCCSEIITGSYLWICWKKDSIFRIERVYLIYWLHFLVMFHNKLHFLVIVWHAHCLPQSFVRNENKLSDGRMRLDISCCMPACHFWQKMDLRVQITANMLFCS